jgi:hypothetical protein
MFSTHIYRFLECLVAVSGVRSQEQRGIDFSLEPFKVVKRV